MHIIDFLQTIQESPNLTGIFVIQLSCSSYPIIFCAQLFNYLKSIIQVPLINIDIYNTKLESIKPQLDISFLGNKIVYLLKDISTLDSSSKKSWLTYLKNYQGPHSIIFFSSPIDPDFNQNRPSNLLINIPDNLDHKSYIDLYQKLYPDLNYDKLFIKKLFGVQENISIDKASIIMNYQSVLGRKFEDFFSSWFNQIIAPDKSLFTLSQYLFAQQPKEFFTLWSSCKLDYPEEFWLAFWSEQIWQAINFITRVNEQSFIDAKKQAQRLPFSFINKDWRKYSLEFLTKAHNFLYMLDYNIKNGATDTGLELWYHKFLLNSF